MSHAPQRLHLALLDGYKVKWDRRTVARDIVQNFYDAAPDFRAVTIQVQRGVIEVRGPATFSLDYLRYLGATSKNDPTLRSAGGFGEGFKICALVLLRDYGVRLTAASGGWQITPTLAPIPELGARELCYDLVHLDPPCQGSLVRIEGADRALRQWFARAAELFHHPDNPRLQRPLWVDRAAGVAIYHAANGRKGDLFYRGQHRGFLSFPKGAGLSFALDDRLSEMDGDRDRRDLRAARPLLLALARRLPDDTLLGLIQHLRPYWGRGNGTLSALIKAAHQRKLRAPFPPRWLARASRRDALNDSALRIGHLLGVRELASLGMPTVAQRFDADHQHAPPTRMEAARARLMAALYEALLGEPPARRPLWVDRVRSPLHFRHEEQRCVMAQHHLRGDFLDAVGPCLTALALHSGKERNSNSDRLTGLLEGAMRLASQEHDWAQRWDALANTQDADALDITDDHRPLLKHGFYEYEDAASLPPINRPLLDVWIFSPPAFPPALELMERVRAHARALDIPITLQLCSLTPQSALYYACRGLPSAWLGRRELRQPRHRAFGDELRLWDNPDDPLLPPDDFLRQQMAEVFAQKARDFRGHRDDGPIANYLHIQRRGAALIKRRNLDPPDPVRERRERLQKWLYRLDREDPAAMVRELALELVLRRPDPDTDPTAPPDREAVLRLQRDLYAATQPLVEPARARLQLSADSFYYLFGWLAEQLRLGLSHAQLLSNLAILLDALCALAPSPGLDGLMPEWTASLLSKLWTLLKPRLEAGEPLHDVLEDLKGRSRTTQEALAPMPPPALADWRRSSHWNNIIDKLWGTPPPKGPPLFSDDDHDDAPYVRDDWARALAAGHDRLQAARLTLDAARDREARRRNAPPPAPVILTDRR